MNLAKQDRLEVLEGLKTIYNIPELSRFLGIVIAMFYNDPDGSILSGQAPSRIQKYIEEWRSLHLDELKEAWIKVQNHEAPGKISPLV